MFQRLQDAMQRQQLTLQNNSLGIQPEQVLVLETMGSVDNFINAVKKVDGLEWLGELEIEDIAPEHGFEDATDPDKQLKGQLFLVMTDQRALEELHSLFRRWQEEPETKFPRGLAPLKHAFAHLRTIRPWDAEDRIRDTFIVEDWKERIARGEDIVPFEIELWFREDPSRRRQADEYLRSLINSLSGEVVQQSVIPEIAYHGVLGRMPIRHVSGLLSEISRLREFRLLQCEDIMQLRPVGQCGIPVPGNVVDSESLEDVRRPPLPTGEPVVALFDGLPLSGHRLLTQRLTVDDPDGYEDAYQARERIHGTAMASLICHGDLREGGPPITSPLYVRPIMQPQRNALGRAYETIPEGVLPIDLVHRAVRRLYDDEGDQPAAAPTVRVINLSIGDRSRPFARGMSSFARLLDWLAWKYNVLFIVSAGNHFQDVELDLPRADLQDLSRGDREVAVVKATAADTRHRRLLSPAETFNGLTIGASHADAYSGRLSSNLIDPFARTGVPSVISAHGPGYRRTVKPEILLSGGRQFLMEKMGTTHPNAVLQVVESIGPPGQYVAAPGAPGEIDRMLFTRGTSNATALASRWAANLLELIKELRAHEPASFSAEYDVVLAKTLLVHGAAWEDMQLLYDLALRNAQNSRAFTEYVGHFLGYGLADVSKVMICTDHRVTVLGVGELDDGDGHEFRFPVPPSLSAITDKRRLVVTLSWLTPVNCRRQKYRLAQLWFDPKKENRVATSRVGADYHAVQRGTVQHEVLEGADAVDFQDGEVITVQVNCRADAGEIPRPVKYGLAVTLEVSEESGIHIYEEVRARLRVRVPIRGRSTV
jgi:hypothetical protein